MNLSDNKIKMQVKKIDENGRPFIYISEGFSMRLEHDELTEEYKEKARRELREVPEIVEKGLKELRELLAGECPRRFSQI